MGVRRCREIGAAGLRQAHVRIAGRCERIEAQRAMQVAAINQRLNGIAEIHILLVGHRVVAADTVRRRWIRFGCGERTARHHDIVCFRLYRLISALTCVNALRLRLNNGRRTAPILFVWCLRHYIPAVHIYFWLRALLLRLCTALNSRSMPFSV